MTSKARIVIDGHKVHDVGYRVFLMNAAFTMGLEKFNALNQTAEAGVQRVVAFVADRMRQWHPSWCL